MYLIDTNIWLERLLEQNNSDIVRGFLEIIPSKKLFVSDFTFHSIGVILYKLNKMEVLPEFVDDLFINGNVSIVSLNPIDMKDIVKIIEKYNLDFDDAYQYVAAKKVT